MRKPVKTLHFLLTSISIHLLALILLMRIGIMMPELKQEAFFAADLVKWIPAPPAPRPYLQKDKHKIPPKSEMENEDLGEQGEQGGQGRQGGQGNQEKELVSSPELPKFEFPEELRPSQSSGSNLGLRISSSSGGPSIGIEREALKSKINSLPTDIKTYVKPEINPFLSILPKGETRTSDQKEPPRLGIGIGDRAETKTEGISDLRPSAKKTPLGIGSARKSVGDGIGNGVGNGIGSGVGSGSLIPQFRELMTDLAKGISENARQKKVDVVIILDTTASMLDNIRGVKAYVTDLLEHLKKNGLDVALGLLKFGDLSESKIEAKGVTEDIGDFRNWLHRTDLNGGGDLAESGLEAIVSALNDLKFRRKSQKFFIFISDGPVHDIDFDGQSKYSLDQIIELVKKEGIQIEVVGIDYLPIKQLAWGTGGQWRHIPGSGFLEQNPMELPFKIYSQLGLEYSLKGKIFEDRVIVYVTDKTEWVSLSWKVLDPMGQRCANGNIENKYLKSVPKLDKIEFEPKIDIGSFNPYPSYPGTYTIIYRITDSMGNSSVLRRTIDFNQKNP